MNLTEIEARINSIIAQDPNAPTEGDTDWNLYSKYINMAQHDWEESYRWPTLFKEVNTMTSQSTGNMTLSLPADFKKADGFLKICTDGGVFSYAQEIPERKDTHPASDRFFYILGSPGNFSMIINPNDLGSGASIMYSYWSSAASLVSGSDVSMCPDPDFLVQRSLGYYWESMSDARFSQARSDAAAILARMVENENTRGHSYDNRVKTVEELNKSFRIGRN